MNTPPALIDDLIQALGDPRVERVRDLNENTRVALKEYLNQVPMETTVNRRQGLWVDRGLLDVLVCVPALAREVFLGAGAMPSGLVYELCEAARKCKRTSTAGLLLRDLIITCVDRAPHLDWHRSTPAYPHEDFAMAPASSLLGDVAPRVNEVLAAAQRREGLTVGNLHLLVSKEQRVSGLSDLASHTPRLFWLGCSRVEALKTLLKDDISPDMVADWPDEGQVLLLESLLCHAPEIDTVRELLDRGALVRVETFSCAAHNGSRLDPARVEAALHLLERNAAMLDQPLESGWGMEGTIADFFRSRDPEVFALYYQKRMLDHDTQAAPHRPTSSSRL